MWPPGGVQEGVYLIPNSIISFGSKKCTKNLLLSGTGKYFPVFTLDPHRPCFD